jgi:small-conductance mechanosensitive channel
MVQRISNDILAWVVMMLAIGFSIIFGFGPVLYRKYQTGYKNFMPTQNYPKWSFLLIFSLVLIANCFYFVFVSQDQHLELTFIILMFLNISLAIVLLKRLNDVEFVPLSVVIDGESVQQDRQLFVFFISAIKLLVVISIVASMSGYLVLSMYTLHNVVITLTSIILFLSLRSLWINSEPKLMKSSELSGISKPQGSMFLLTIVELLLAIGLFLAAARFWGVSLNNFEGQSRLMRGEFKVGSLTIEFSQMLASVFAFLIVFYFFKLVRWFLRERFFKTVKVTVAASEAVLAIVGYIGFSFAVVASLNALGVQSENLAIVAGALSVGIGFGLQTIFSNFVSGLIILFERPVRVGDWVILGNGLEGHIKKVNMRSTEVITLERSSVLIPNSNLLSDTITNWTLNDNIGRLDINIGVAYGSNTELVKEVLLGVAAEHPKLRRYPAARVLFKDFGESSLDLTLRFFLVNINDRHQVGSDLRFAIDKAFRENNITIPFPQRDVHFKPNDFKDV